MDGYESSKPVSGYCFIKKYKMQNIHVLLHKTNHAFLSNLIMSMNLVSMHQVIALLKVTNKKIPVNM